MQCRNRGAALPVIFSSGQPCRVVMAAVHIRGAEPARRPHSLGSAGRGGGNWQHGAAFRHPTPQPVAAAAECSEAGACACAGLGSPLDVARGGCGSHNHCCLSRLDKAALQEAGERGGMAGQRPQRVSGSAAAQKPQQRRIHPSTHPPTHPHSPTMLARKQHRPTHPHCFPTHSTQPTRPPTLTRGRLSALTLRAW